MVQERHVAAVVLWEWKTEKQWKTYNDRPPVLLLPVADGEHNEGTATYSPAVKSYN